ncbi:hypothetical protein PMF13cell1_03540 [Blautia producta]|uniref:Uncharacterized protein n=2 Tax=Blautia producta TaxID=33035 RepID=A0A4P6M3P5_9FIRM|nr:hypothetical protein PMF13cell1_03540 [Blautia producta]
MNCPLWQGGLSYLSEEEQRLTLESDVMPDAEQVKQLRAEAGKLTEKHVKTILKSEKTKPISITIPEAWMEKFFQGMEKKQISATIEEALVLWANH